MTTFTRQRLEPVGERLWLAEGPLVSFYGFPYPTRCAIARLPGGALWVWSPIELDAGLRREVDALGDVGHPVSPNAIHPLYLQDWAAVWPDAALWGPQSTLDKRVDLAFSAALGDTPPPAWLDD